MKKQLRYGVLVVLSLNFLLGCGVAWAEIKEVVIGVDGLSCPFCVQGLAKKLNKVKSFEQVDISYKLGLARVELKEKSFLDLAEVKQAMKESGFTLRDITITAIGTIVDWEDSLALRVQGSKQIFLIYESAKLLEKFYDGQIAISEDLKNQLKQWQGEERLVSITGKVHEHPEIPPALVVEEISRVEE